MRTNTSPLFYKCGILKFVDLIACKALIIMFKVKNNLLPIGIQSLFTINSNHTIQDKVVNLIINMFPLP